MENGEFIILPNPSVKNLISKRLATFKVNDVKSLMYDQIGLILFHRYCKSDPVYTNILKFINYIISYSRMPAIDRTERAAYIFKKFIVKYSLELNDFISESNLLKIIKTINNLCNEEKSPIININTNFLSIEFFKDIEEEIYIFLDQKFHSFMKSNYFVRYCQWKDVEYSLQPVLEDFHLLQMIGKGSYGAVYLCERIQTKKRYAIKCMEVKKEKNLENVTNEANLKYEISFKKCNFIVGLSYAFAKDRHIYFILDLMEGGTLSQHIYERGKFEIKTVIHYSSQIILALSYLHSMNIISRDVNPSNILLDTRGQAKLNSLRLAGNYKKQNFISKTGKVGFMAPEVIDSQGKPYGPEVDIFSLGCLIYKLTTGKSPFSKNSSDLKVIESLTLNCDFEFSCDIPENLLRLLKQLILKNPEERLKIDEIKKQIIYKELDWNNVLELKYDSPFIPSSLEVNMPTCKISPSMNFSNSVKFKSNENFEFDAKKFPSFTVGSSWQQEIISAGLFEKTMKMTSEHELSKIYVSPSYSPHKYCCIVEGEIFLLTNQIFCSWQKRNLYIYYNQLVLTYPKEDYNKIPKDDEIILYENISSVSNNLERYLGMNNCLIMHFKGGKHLVFTGSSLATSQQWCLEIFNWFNKINEDK